MTERIQKGFSAAELLIAIFVGAAFILTGYQLYGIITSTSAAARNQAIASNIAYANLRLYAGNVGNSCGAASITPIAMPSSASLPKPNSMYASITCPYGNSSPISEVAIFLYYGTNNEVVEHAILANQG